MTRFFLLLGLLVLPCSVTAFAQAPPSPVLPALTNNHVYGKIVARDAAKKTVTVFASGKTVVVALDPSIRIFKMADLRGHPTGKFDDLAIGAEISVHLTAASAGTEALVGDEIRVRREAPATPRA